MLCLHADRSEGAISIGDEDDSQEESAAAQQALTAVAMDSSRMLPKSARTLPSRLVQMLEPMRILPAGSMPYSLGMTASASCLAACTRTAHQHVSTAEGSMI